MRWTEYGIAMLTFSGVSLLVLYVIERMQQWLPWNPQHLPNVAGDLAWNTAVSFTTNTNWQVYTPEATMSYLTQMAGLAYHNFASAAVGIALAIALIRGVARRESKTIGNFWVDTTRAFLWVLLPLCLVLALTLVSQGVIQNLHPYTNATLIEPQTVDKTDANGATTKETITTQTIAQGPVASQEAHQDARHQRRGLFQRQQCSSLRKSHSLHEFPRNAHDLHDPRWPHVYARAV